MSEEETDKCWKKFAGKMEEEVLDKYKVSIHRKRLFLGIEACTKKQEVQNTKVSRRLLGKNFLLVQRV